MKKTTTKLYIIATLFFVFNILSTSMNLNPMYPGTAFFYCFAITVYIAIGLISKAGKLILSRREDGAMTVDFEKKAPFKKTPVR